MFRIPFWPSFTKDSTAEGMTLWAVMTTWFYVTPIILLMIGRQGNR
jgi:hypothetical protein